MNDYDYIIVGQGLAGSALSYILIKNNYNVLVIDKFNTAASSQVAAGLVNPVTGRRIVKSWMADELIPYATNFYKNIEKELGKDFFHPMDALEVVYTVKDYNDWTSRMNEAGMQKYHIKDAPEALYRDKIKEYVKLMRIGSSAWMNIPEFLKLLKIWLKQKSALSEEAFDYTRMLITDELIMYGAIKTKKIIFCEGINAKQNPLWNWLPFLPAKGELLTIKCDKLPEDYILISGIFFIPIGKNQFRVGSTYEWNFSDELPSDHGKLKLINILDNLLLLPYSVLNHQAGIRPTVKDRRPLLGKHYNYNNVFVFNGMGTKGVQLVPYFANQLAEYLDGKINLNEEVNVKRFYPD